MPWKRYQRSKKISYNPLGNYDYLTQILKDDYLILRIDQRNHGKSGKNIDIPKLKELLNVPEKDQIIKTLLKRDKQKINDIIKTYLELSTIIKKHL